MREDDFAADFEVLREACCFEFGGGDVQRDAADGADVGGDVFADGSVAAGDTDFERGFVVGSGSVLQGEREAVEFELADEVGFFVEGEAGLDAVGPGAEFVGVVGVVEREHGARVGDLGEAVFGLAADALGGGVGGEERGVRELEGAELVHAGVVLGVGPGGGVEDVVEVLVVAELFAQGVDAGGGVGGEL